MLRLFYLRKLYTFAARIIVYNKFKMRAFIIFIVFFISVASAQTAYTRQSDIVLTGMVTDHQGEPLPGATVRIENTQFGTVTDADGRYLLRGRWKKGNMIVFSFIGMKDVREKYTGQKVQDAAMQQDTKSLDEVVVVARQNINELDIRAKSGVVQSVDMGRLNSKPMIDMSLALQGSVPGLIVTNTGDLGSKPEIRIRGNSSFREGDAANEPLYVMDGQVISSDAFMTLNPADIKEIKVLKDAVACALYGIKAANGVIEITSLRGNPDGRTTTNYSFNMGITTRGRRGIEMMDTDEKLELERRLQNVSTPGYRYSEDYYRKYYPTAPNLDEMIAYGRGVLDSLRTINTDWFDELIHCNIYQRHNLSVRGGTEKTSYYVSVNYAQQGGRVPGNDTQRFTARMSLDQMLGKWGYLSLSADAGYSETDTPNGSSYSPTDLVYQLNPYETKDGTLVSFSNETSDYTYKDLLSQYQSKSTDKRGGVSGSLNLEPFKGFNIDAVAGIDMVLNEGMTLVPSTSIEERQSGVPEEERGKLTKQKRVTTNVSSNVRVTYNKIFNEKHDFTVGGNMDYYMTDDDEVSIIGYGVGTRMSPANINQSITGNRKPSVGSTKEKTAQLGVGLVAGYSFDSTYDFFATYKADASSVLPKDKRWNAAWAVGLGWTLSRYPFLKDNKVLSRLNLKASYGRMANLAGVSASSTIGTFSYSTNYYGDSRLLQLLALYNTGLKAEQTASTDFSMSMEFFKRFTLDANIYRRETSDALLDVPVPLSNGFGTMKRNIGVLRNEGYELSASLRLLDRQDLRFSIGGSLAYNRNKVVDLYYTERLYASDDKVPDYEVGKSYDMIYGLKSLGINPVTGLPVFEGPDGSEVDVQDAMKRENIVALGHGTPPYSGTLNLSFSYRDFDLDMDFYYVFGGIKIYDYSYVRWKDDANKNAIKGQVDNMWFQRGDEGKTYHSPFYSSAAIEALDYPNTKTVGKSDYLKLSMVSLRYRVPHKFLEKNCNFIKYANVAFQASNLFMITPYEESDPETGSLAGTMQPVLTINLSLTF